MEKDSKQSGGGLPTNGLVALVILAAGALVVRQTPLEATRSAAGAPRLEQHFSFQDVDARLWQDPLSAIAKARAEARKGNADKAAADEKRRTAANLALEIRERTELRDARDKRAAEASGGDAPSPADKVEILAVMLPGGPYAENVETRRRARYAVVAGLNASRLEPTESEHLGYFAPDDPGTGPNKAIRTLPEVVPYEWFEPATDVKARKAGGRLPLVLVMWLQNEAFAEQPLQRLALLAKPFLASNVRWRVLGPGGSDGLRAMIEEAAADAPAPSPIAGMGMRIYSPYATVSDRVLLSGVKLTRNAQGVTDFLGSRHVDLIRTIGNDSTLVDAMIGELSLRGLKAARLPTDKDASESYNAVCRPRSDGNAEAPSHIAVIAEWDALYGRSLRREFRAKADEAGFCVERLNYVRGLDGQLPVNEESASAAAAAGKPAAGDKDDARRQDGTFMERPEGHSQFDYLRRLSVQLHDLDARLQATSEDGLGLRAIGVLGNDVQDKLLVLQALQPEFPNTLFFTTDLDARFMHPREKTWARNLIVVSNFGLRLNDRLQGGTPPFRDSYQTSIYLSTRLAVDDARRASHTFKVAEAAFEALPLSQGQVDRWFAVPRIFEIGRTGAFDFSPGGGPAGSWLAGNDPCPNFDLAGCASVHPPGSPRYPQPATAMLFLSFSFVALCLWAPVLMASREVRAALTRFVHAGRAPGDTALRWGALAAAVLLVNVIAPLALAGWWQPIADWLTRDGKPLVVFEGISLWPTAIIRLFALLLCIYLVFQGCLMLIYNLDKICKSFGFCEQRAELIDRQRERDAKRPLWRRVVRMFSIGFMLSRDDAHASSFGMSDTAVAFWERYIVQDRLAARLVRTTVYVLVALPLSYLLVRAFGEDRFLPLRGELSLVVHEGLRIATLLATYFLIFFVVDATLLCVGFVRGLRPLGTNWPDATVRIFEYRTGIARTHLDKWIDLEFIALRTRSVTRLIYFPFIVLSLLFLSRSAVFDHWRMSASTLVLIGIGVAIAFGCAMLLQSTAEESRRHALAQVDDELMLATAKPAPLAKPVAGAGMPPPTVEQLELLRTRIHGLHEGAFAALWQQPFVRAALLPFASLGGTTLLDYATLVSP